MILSPRDALYASIAARTWPDIRPFTPVPIVEDLLSPRLYAHQRDPLAQVAALMRAGYRRVLLQAPTGFGKTVCAESVIGSTLDQDLRALFLVHRKELLRQTGKTFTAAGLHHGFVARGFPFQPDASLLLAGVQTLVNRLDQILPPNLIIVDECHHATAAQWARVLEAYPDAFILGLTATPERLDGRGLEEHFDVMVSGPSVAWLIEHGYLSPFDFYAPHIPDMSAVPNFGNDFNAAAAAAVVDRPKIIGNIVEHYLRLCPGEQGIVFCASVEHSKHVADAFNAEGIRAMHVDGEMEETQRTFFDEAFRAQDITIGVNVDLFGEGYDVPNVSYVGDGAPSRSKIKVLQRWGRALRTAPGKRRAVICDHAGNAVEREMGLPDDERTWSLQGRAGRKASGINDDAIPVRQCKSCYRVAPSSARVCPGCGAEASPTPREIEQRKGELKKLERAEMQAAAEERKKALRRQLKAEEKACTGYPDLLALARSRNYENPAGWARMRMSMRANYPKRFRR